PSGGEGGGGGPALWHLAGTCLAERRGSRRFLCGQRNRGRPPGAVGHRAGHLPEDGKGKLPSWTDGGSVARGRTDRLCGRASPLGGKRVGPNGGVRLRARFGGPLSPPARHAKLRALAQIPWSGAGFGSRGG